MDGEQIYPAAGLLVMAIEGVKQTCESRDLITAFEIRNAVFACPLPTSTSSEAGVEAQISLLPLSRDDLGPSKWFEFRIYKVEQTEFVECCYGKIKAHCKESSCQGDASLSSKHLSQAISLSKPGPDAKTSHINKREFYDSLNRIGAEYGPSFQVIQEVELSNDCKTAATIGLDQHFAERASGSLDSITIHPSTLDGLFQMVFPAVKGMTKAWDDLPVMVPSRLGHLWLSSQRVSNMRDDVVKAFAHSKMAKDQSSTISTVSANSERTKETCILMEGYQSTIVSAPRHCISQNPLDRHLCWYMDWKPDVDLMTKQQLADYCTHSDLGRKLSNGLVRDSSAEMFTSPTMFAPLATYINALAHKNPNMRILEIGAGSRQPTTVVLEALRALGGHKDRKPRCRSYECTDVLSESLSSLKATLPDYTDFATFNTLDIRKDPVQQGFAEGQYDIVLSSTVGLISLRAGWKLIHTYYK